VPDGLIWEEPPVLAPVKTTWTKAIRQLAQRPGEWARMPTTMKGRAGCSNLRTRHPECEWTWERNSEGTFTIWGRYIGTASSPYTED